MVQIQPIPIWRNYWQGHSLYVIQKNTGNVSKLPASIYSLKMGWVAYIKTTVIKFYENILRIFIFKLTFEIKIFQKGCSQNYNLT